MARILLLAAFLAGYGCDAQPRFTPLAPEAVVLAFGDSLTAGTGASAHESYPAVLETRIARTVVNAGVPGETSAQGLARLPRTLERVEPALVVLMHGGNDFLRRLNTDKTADNLIAMIELVQAHGANVILLGVPDPGLFLSTAKIYHSVAKATGVVLEADIVPDLLGDNHYKADAVHPNARGYARMAEAVHDVLRETGAL